MGQCCLIFAKKQPQEDNKQTELLTRTQLALQYQTRNDKEFTYYLGVYNLLTLGQKLESPEYLDDLHPNFSYQKFADYYAQYQREIKKLGKYIQKYRNKQSQLAKRIAIDRLNIETFKKNNKVAGKIGCLVKMQLQEVRWPGATLISVKVLHPSDWPSKFQKSYKVDLIHLGLIYIQFCIPQYKDATVQISSKETKGDIQIKVEQCINNDELVICKIMKWKGAGSIEGIALRIQIVNEEQQGEKLKIAEMNQLFSKLNQDYGVEQIEPSMSEKDINQKLSRHRQSVSHKYNQSPQRKP